MIQSILVRSLFGTKDIHLTFKSPFTILTAENGSGKTTLLTIVYAVLSGNFYKLRRFNFSEITVVFNSGERLTIPKSAIKPGFELSRENPSIRRLLHQVPEAILLRLRDETFGSQYIDFRRHPLTREIVQSIDVPARYLYDVLSHGDPQLALNLPSDPEFLIKARNVVATNLHSELLYFPTYRRIEEDLDDLGFAKKEGSPGEALIRFGMSDVSDRITKITDDIKNSSVAWYSKINGQMLSQLVDGIPPTAVTVGAIQNREALRIVLDRIGTNIKPEDKEHILQLTETGEIALPRYEVLAYFLSNLVKIYDQQKESDNAIKEFTKICNFYLVDKEFIYNESEVKLGVFRRRGEEKVELSSLSSGEKQIISLFSRLYLETQGRYTILFDEPELSLSIEWQRALLPHIVNSGRCVFLLAATHSPFIFDNDLDRHTVDLGSFVRDL